MKLLVNDFKIKAYYKDEDFYDMNKNKIDKNSIQQIILEPQEFKEILQSQKEKTEKKKNKNE